jgi:hypothetical protein
LLRDKIEGRLVGAGYKLVEGTPDVEISLALRSQFEPSMFNVTVNGQPSGKTHVWATVSLFGAGALVDRVESDWTGDAGAVDDAAVGTIVSSIGYSSGLRRYASLVEQRRQGAQLADEAKKAEETKTIEATKPKEADVKELAAEAEAKRQKEEQELAWPPASRTCAAAATPTACDALHAFVAKYPEGGHASEAKTLLELARPKIETLQKDEGAWQAAEIEVCRSSRTRRACAKVDVYAIKYPAGLHILEAQELLRGVR